MDLEKAKAEIVKINQRLKDSGYRVSVILKGKRSLALQATLPLKRGGGRKQQAIALGLVVSKDALRRAEMEAQTVGKHLIMGTFSWEPYLRLEEEPEEDTTAKLIERFKEWYFRQSDIKESTWVETWGRTLGKLPQDDKLTEAAILGVVLLTNPHTRSRELACHRLQRFADFAGLSVNLKEYQGEYGDRKIEPRNIPSPELIAEWRDKIPTESWQWVYGMLAVFGMRPHEAFFCHFIEDYTLQITEGKTGPRLTRAMNPKWCDEWNLRNTVLPNVKGRSYRDYGMRVQRQFERYKVPFDPYDLRHYNCIQASVLHKLPVSVASANFGHSVKVHTQTYHRWISDAVMDEVYRETVLKNSLF